MDHIDEDEKMRTAGRYAVAMHLEANAKVGRIAWIVIVLTIATAVLMRSFWPIITGIALCVALYFYIINSCVRYVKRKTGMPDQVQGYFSRLYKTDSQFAVEVDDLRNGSKVAARNV